MQMVGRRKENPLGLEPRVYTKRGKFWYFHKKPNSQGKLWEDLGTDIAKANAKARLYNDTAGLYGTISYWLDMFVSDCEVRVKAADLAVRTLADYTDDVVPLKVYFAPPMTPGDILPSHVQGYLDIGRQVGRPTRANREKACLSSMLSWLLRREDCPPGFHINPCFKVSGVKTNTEHVRDRYVEDADYNDTFAAAPQAVRDLMTLTYRTLQRPESDIILWTTANVTRKGGKRIIRNDQNKVNDTVVEIEVTAELDEILTRLIGEVPVIGRTLLRGSRGKFAGKPYTYDGISAMLKYAIKKANEKRAKEKKPKIEAFGFRDCKGKGATDMWLSGVPIEKIQLLCGHASKETTETYVKQRWRQTAMPNEVSLAV